MNFDMKDMKKKYTYKYRQLIFENIKHINLIQSLSRLFDFPTKLNRIIIIIVNKYTTQLFYILK